MRQKIALISAWYNEKQIEKFKQKWELDNIPDYVNLYLVQDKNKEGCGATKNKGIQAARKDDCDYYIILDDDCFPYENNLESFVNAHVKELCNVVDLNMYEYICFPFNRGTPKGRHIRKRVMLCMGFWEGVPDYWATTDPCIKPDFRYYYIHNKLFSLSGMNMSFRKEVPFQFDITDRYDDIWGGWRAQEWIYRHGGCCSTYGPVVFHSRQSDREKNKVIEDRNREKNETIFREIGERL